MDQPDPQSNHAIQCRCGQVSGRLDLTFGHTHLVCFCRDCQAYAHYLGAAGALDRAGGTYVIQTTPQAASIDRGHAHIRGLRLTPGGVGRWYAECCGTPIANSPPTRQVPFLGIVAGAAVYEADAPSPMTPDEDVIRVFTEGAHDPAIRAQRSSATSVGMKILRMIVAARLRGEHRNHPFFDQKTGKPISPMTSPDAARRANAYRAAAKPPGAA